MPKHRTSSASADEVSNGAKAAAAGSKLPSARGRNGAIFEVADEGAEPGIRGAQSLRRAVSILRVVSQWGDRGCRPKLVAEQTGLSLATADRLLRALADERLLERHGPDRLYRIGPEIVFLAAVRGPQFSLGAHYDLALRELTDRLKETTFLWLRVGDAATCLARYETNYPIRVLSGDVGVRRPLGVGAGTLAILASLPENEMQETVKRNRRLYKAYNLTAEDVLSMAKQARAVGYAVNESYFVSEVASVAVPIKNSNGVVLGSIGVITFRSHFTDELRMKYITQLNRVLEAVPAPLD